MAPRQISKYDAPWLFLKAVMFNLLVLIGHGCWWLLRIRMAHPLRADVCCVLECDTATDLAAVHLDRQNTVVIDQGTKMIESDIYLYEAIAWVAT
jgi:hypothetical protein